MVCEQNFNKDKITCLFTRSGSRNFTAIIPTRVQTDFVSFSTILFNAKNFFLKSVTGFDVPCEYFESTNIPVLLLFIVY
jgi:hypothetical protein